jgi:tRNA threonylcarbamoyladenosine biosynthesis protein TsaB
MIAMLVLGIETSSVVGTIALTRNSTPVFDRTVSVDMEHSANLLPSMEVLLESSGTAVRDLDAVAVGVGPGSYTGVRVGIAFAKGLAYGLKVPVVGVCSFESMLYEYRGSAGVICTLVDAKMGGTYWAAYRWDKEEMIVVQAPIVSRVEEVELDWPAKALFLSPDIEKFMGVLGEKFKGRAELEFKEAFPKAAYIAVRGGLRLRQKHPEENLEPYYLRPSMAEVTWAKKHEKEQ